MGQKSEKTGNRIVLFHMIRAIIELELVFPYKISIATLVEFCSLWDSTILYGGTKRRKSVISMPSRHFKSIFGTNPMIAQYSVPKGMGHFIEGIKVIEILVK